MAERDDEDGRQYRVVMNHEEYYSIWPVEKDIPAGWREEGTTGIPVVAPPAGSDVYMLARLWEWWPVLQLKKGESYRLHLSSLDWQHGFSLQPENINVQVHPEYDLVMTITPNTSGEFSVICNEFCGIGHHTMVGKIYVTE